MEEKERINVLVQKVAMLLGFDIEPTLKETLNADGEADIVCAITIENDSQFLIGHYGANLAALEHIVHSIARQEGLTARFRIDVNNYREGKKQMFLRIAGDAAQDAVRTRKPVVLRPMNAYERRIIHTTLAEHEGVTTESIGSGEERKVVVNPASIMASL